MSQDPTAGMPELLQPDEQDFRAIADDLETNTVSDLDQDSASQLSTGKMDLADPAECALLLACRITGQSSAGWTRAI